MVQVIDRAKQIAPDRPEAYYNEASLTQEFKAKASEQAALPMLEKLRDSDEQKWKNVSTYIRRAIHRIKSGNPDASRMD